jgi:hypothetical protein
MLSSDSIVVAAKDQVGCDLAGEAVILNLASGVYYGLDAVGARIWHLIQAPKAVRDIRDALLREYDIDAERCERELLALLQELAGHGLIEVQSATPA